MKTKTILVAVMALVVFGATSDTADASRGYLVNETTAVFFMDFSIDADYGNVAIPALADHTVEHNDRVDVVGYTVTADNDAPVAIESATDLILSKTVLENNRYQVEQGQTEQFMLMSIVVFAEPVTSNLRGYITKLPFWVNSKRTTLHQNQLDELETATIKTSSVAK